MRMFFVYVLLSALLALPVLADVDSEVIRLLQSARSQIGKTVRYDGSYQTIAYPNGDIPLERGVCTDVVIRAYRTLGVDLQRLVHEDLRDHFHHYPSKRIWGLTKPDPNIDHRRVPNLRAFFKRHGEVYSTDLEKHPPQPGDLLTWRLPKGLPHIGIVSDSKRSDGKQYLIIHNIGQGTSEEDLIGQYELTGHYRYTPWIKR
ncbi:DUF1287 domain-containing protein [Oligoflexia bacterium]|nr:DUF1287 domain-containing protein [Oligoflexia bacterium]